jgi:Flp pilus assembly protein CpaB
MADTSTLSDVGAADRAALGIAGRAARPLRRPHALPGGRAVLGGLLVALAATGLFWSYTRVAAGPRHAFVVLRNPVRVGARITAADVRLEKMDLPAAVERLAFASPTDVVGTTATAPLLSGQLVQRSDVLARGSGRAREVTFTVDRAHTSAVVTPGEYVDVVATFGAGEQTKSNVVMRRVLVVGFAGSRGTFTDGTYQVTVAVEGEADALKLTAAAQGAKVSLVRSSGALDGTAVTP